MYHPYMLKAKARGSDHTIAMSSSPVFQIMGSGNRKHGFKFSLMYCVMLRNVFN